MADDNRCDVCNKTFSTNYVLQNHLKLVHQQSSAGNVEKLMCPSGRCRFTSVYKCDMKRHIQKCVFIAFDNEVKQLVEENTKLRTQIDDLYRRLDTYMNYISRHRETSI
jgi:hypothetical protein